MGWNRRYSSMSHVKSALWTVPVFALITEFAAHLLTEQLGGWLVAHRFYDVDTGFLRSTHRRHMRFWTASLP